MKRSLIKQFILLLYRISNRAEIEGIKVGVLGNKRAEALVIRNKVGAALTLMRQCDPRRYVYLKRDVKRILVFGRPGYRGQWHQSLALCELTDAYVLDPRTTPAMLAATLAHEAMHARLYRWGIGYDYEKVVRVERICFKASIAFARRLPLSERASRNYITEETTRQINRDPAY